MKIGDEVRIVKCDVCPKVVGKEVKIVEVKESGGVKVNFGRGRPQLNRPTVFLSDDLVLILADKFVPAMADQQNG